MYRDYICIDNKDTHAFYYSNNRNNATVLFMSEAEKFIKYVNGKIGSKPWIIISLDEAYTCEIIDG